MVNAGNIPPFPTGYQPRADGAFLGNCPYAHVEVFALLDTGSEIGPLRGRPEHAKVGAVEQQLIMRVCGELQNIDARIQDIGVTAPAIRIDLRSTE